MAKKKAEAPPAAPAEKPLTIMRLEVERIKRIKAVRVDTKGRPVVEITGKNSQGKTSLMDAIVMGIMGTSALPDKPVNDGADKGTITIDFGEFTLTRTVYPDRKNEVVITTKGGKKIASPDALLRELYSHASFDPLELTRMHPKDQKATLAKAVGLDFAALDAKREELFDQRHDVNAELKSAKARLEKAPRHPDAPSEPVNASELNERYKEAVDSQAHITRLKQNEATMDADIKQLQAKLKAAVVALEQTRKSIAEHEAEPHENPDEVRKQLQEIQTTNQRVADNKAHAELKKAVDSLEMESNDLTEQIDEVDAAKVKALEEAKFPVKGLGFGEDGLILNGIDFTQASQSEQIRVSTAVALALHPRIRLAIIREASLLDDDSKQIIAQMAEAAGGQVWEETVDSKAPFAVVIEDGSVKGA